MAAVVTVVAGGGDFGVDPGVDPGLDWLGTFGIWQGIPTDVKLGQKPG